MKIKLVLTPIVNCALPTPSILDLLLALVWSSVNHAHLYHISCLKMADFVPGQHEDLRRQDQEVHQECHRTRKDHSGPFVAHTPTPVKSVF